MMNELGDERTNWCEDVPVLRTGLHNAIAHLRNGGNVRDMLSNAMLSPKGSLPDGKE